MLNFVKIKEIIFGVSLTGRIKEHVHQLWYSNVNHKKTRPI